MSSSVQVEFNHVGRLAVCVREGVGFIGFFVSFEFL